MAVFIITSDAVLALITASLLVMWVSDLTASKNFQTDDILAEYGHDFLAVAEKSGAFTDLNKFNSTKFRMLIKKIPADLCAEAEMTFQNGSLYYHADNYNDTEIGIKTGCLKKNYKGEEMRPTTFIKVSRIAVYQGIIRPVTIELWYKGWKD